MLTVYSGTEYNALAFHLSDYTTPSTVIHSSSGSQHLGDSLPSSYPRRKAWMELEEEKESEFGTSDP